MMLSRYSRNQKVFVLVVMVLLSASAVVSIQLFGPGGMAVPLVLGLLLIVVLLLELRAYQLDFFVRQQRESRTMFSQIEAYIGIVETLRPTLPLPATRGWAASPDLLREVVKQVLLEPTEVVVEASSGTSTLVIGYCMKRVGSGHVYSLEHDPVFAGKTRQAVRDHGLEEFVTVLDAPLVQYSIDGNGMLWYDLSGLSIDAPIDLLVVDGPPDVVQPMARYPAVPLLKEYLSKQARVLLDDGSRPDEQEAAKRWSALCPGSKLEFLALETGAWLLRLDHRGHTE
jgi:hypothetical protein